MLVSLPSAVDAGEIKSCEKSQTSQAEHIQDMKYLTAFLLLAAVASVIDGQTSRPTRPTATRPTGRPTTKARAPVPNRQQVIFK